MRERQRELAAEGNVVIEGRDIGTVVAPQAEVKVYLVADPSVRTLRRQAERPDIGADALATDLKLRDESDRVRMQRGRGRRGDRHDRSRDRGRDRQNRGPRAALRRPSSPSGLRRLRLADVAALDPPLALALTRGRGYGLDRIPPPAAACLRSTISRGSTSCSSGRSRRGTSTTSRRSSCAAIPGFGRFLGLARDHLRQARRVGSRRGPH